MTDKVQKIRAFLVGIADADGVSTILARAIENKILPYIDSMQEEPVSEELEEAPILSNSLNTGKNTWSEKDEIRWNNVILMVEAAFVGEEEKKYAEWLKSLKGRFVPQTKREWSHEDEKMLRDIDACIVKLPVFYSKIEINGEEKTCSDFIINARHWLKSLRS